VAVSESYRQYVLDQLGRVEPVTARAMFGGVGLYARGVFFALIGNDRLYFKVDDSNRPDFEAHGMGPCAPFDDETRTMQYYEVPGEVLDDIDELPEWVDKAVSVARRKRSKRR
jgi:DNA transformation protein